MHHVQNTHTGKNTTIIQGELNKPWIDEKPEVVLDYIYLFVRDLNVNLMRMLKHHM